MLDASGQCQRPLRIDIVFCLPWTIDVVWIVVLYLLLSNNAWEKLVSYSVGALSPVNHKGLHQGWTQTSLYLQVIHFTSHHTTSHVFCCCCCCFKPIHIPQALNTGTCIQQGDLFYSAGLNRNHGTQPTQEKSGEVLEKCRWMDRKGGNKHGRNPLQ